MNTEIYVSKLIELARYQIDVIEELLLELMQYREIEEIEKLDALIEARKIREEIGE